MGTFHFIHRKTFVSTFYVLEKFLCGHVLLSLGPIPRSEIHYFGNYRVIFLRICQPIS